jgi:hypothetical protein
MAVLRAVDPIEEERPPWPSRAAALGAGALLALALSLARSALNVGNRGRLPPPGEPAWWIADRDADAVYALDRERILARSVAIPRPVAVRATADGGAWVVRSTTATERGGRNLLRIRADGTTAEEIPLGGHPVLAAPEGGEALVIEDGARSEDPRRLVRCGEGGRRRILLEETGLVCAIGVGDTLFAGSSSGEILRFDAEDALAKIERVRLEGPIFALANAGRGSIYVLRGGDGARLARLEPDLSVAWSVPCGSHRAELAATPDGDVWIVDADAQFLRKFDRAGKLGLERPFPPVGAISAIAASESGGVVLATPGALLVFDEKGNARPGQGGFAFVVDVDRMPGR